MYLYKEGAKTVRNKGDLLTGSKFQNLKLYKAIYMLHSGRYEDLFYSDNYF